MDRQTAAANDNIAKGRIGEDACAREYEKRGYEISARNWRRGKIGEIDIIAENREKSVICFCEVKTRKDSRFASAGEAVDFRKRLRIRKLTQLYLLERPWLNDFYVRFDVAEVYFGDSSGTRKTGELRIDIIESAF